MYIIGYNGTEIDAVRVLALRPIQFIPELPSQADIMTVKQFSYHVLAKGECDKMQFSAIIKFWNNLPAAEQDRCHHPAYALQFFLKEEIVLTAALCWGCNNISVDGPLAKIGWRLFNGHSDTALQLWRLCSEVAGYI